MSDTHNRARRGATARLSEDEGGPRQAVRKPERLDADSENWSDQQTVNPGWRSDRSSTRPMRRSRSGLPSSPQEFQLWLQAGGWRYIAGIALLLVVLLIALLAFGRNDQRDVGLGLNQDPEPIATTLPESGAGADVGAQPIPAPEPTAVPQATVQNFIVTGTGDLGLFLRPAPNTDNEPLATLADGTQVEQIGPDTPGSNYVWRQIRTPDGLEGWVAIEFLQPVP
ncbi:MAG: SH3 domain-containing protein [Oscillochloris sp.]|nr:SH3 domain-containing protein [Oscillochloris sp.]